MFEKFYFDIDQPVTLYTRRANIFSSDVVYDVTTPYGNKDGLHHLADVVEFYKQAIASPAYVRPLTKWEVHTPQGEQLKELFAETFGVAAHTHSTVCTDESMGYIFAP